MNDDQRRAGLRVERATGMKLDFEPETLPILDHYVRERRAEVVAKPELVEVLAAPSNFFAGMAGSRVPIVVSHGEGRASFASDAQRRAAIA